MRCAFCGHDGPLTAEHVFPAWIRPFLEDPGGGLGKHRRTTIRFGEPEDQRHEYRGGPAELTVRSVCAGCNNGWMSRLEVEARPFLATVLRNHGRTYYEHGMSVLATWFVKTALVSGSKFPPALPRTFYEQVRAHRQPSQSTRVWLAATPYWQQHYLDYRQIRVHAEDSPPPLEPNAYSAVISMGPVAGLVVSWVERIPDMAGIERFAPALVQVWPTDGGTAAWPPRGGRLNHAALDALADSIVSADDVRARRGRPADV